MSEAIEKQMRLELDVRIEKSELMTDRGSILFEELRFNHSLLIKYCITVKRRRKSTKFWFDKREAAYAFFDALYSEVIEPQFIQGKEYREI